MSRIIFNKQTGELQVMPDPRIINRNRFTPQNLSILPKTLPNIPRGIGSIPNIPSLENIDFSNLPMGMDLTKFDPRAINANPHRLSRHDRASSGTRTNDATILPVHNSCTNAYNQAVFDL
jgi:hypothetical protein